MLRVSYPFALPGETPPGPELVLTKPLPATAMRWSQILLVANRPTRIVEKLDQRLDLLILNTGMAGIFLDRDGSVAAARSFPLPGGAAISVANYVGEIWAVCPAPVILGLAQSIY